MLSQNACLKYNEFVQKYQLHIYPMLAERMQRLFTECNVNRTLDLGIGPGDLTVFFAKQNVGQIDGLDINPFMLALANKKIASHDLSDRVKLVQGDVHSLPYPDACFDLVFSYSCFHHWEDPIQGLKECVRILKEGGALYLVDSYSDVKALLPQFQQQLDEYSYREIVKKAIEESIETSTIEQFLACASMSSYELRPVDFSEEELVAGIVYINYDNQLIIDSPRPTLWELIYRKPYVNQQRKKLL
ncbi:class I SAM-dependent methyltransferase [Serratia nevei]|uniref:class I SAM-dependent methyltransferase n=1 Tax=Serratia nevei TaxID=2703794 RepID=UPI003D366445